MCFTSIGRLDWVKHQSYLLTELARFGALVEILTSAPRSHPYYIPAFAILRMIYEFFPEI
jgi:hypothetical protein